MHTNAWTYTHRRRWTPEGASDREASLSSVAVAIPLKNNKTERDFFGLWNYAEAAADHC